MTLILTTVSPVFWPLDFSTTLSSVLRVPLRRDWVKYRLPIKLGLRLGRVSVALSGVVKLRPISWATSSAQH